MLNQDGGQTKTSVGQTADRISENTLAREPSIANLQVLSTNACSILSKMDNLQLHIQQEHPDIIAITESWLSPDIGESEILLVYCAFRSDRLHRNRGGVLIYAAFHL